MAGGLEPLGNPLGKSVRQSRPSSVFFYLTYREHFYTQHMAMCPSLGSNISSILLYVYHLSLPPFPFSGVF